jgi:hypothetical protein
MWRSALLLAVVPLALGLAGCGDEGDSDTDRLTTATELADSWIEGWDTSDPEMVASVFTDDGKYTSFNGNTYEGEENAQHVRDGGGWVTNLVSVGELTETSEGTFTWVNDGDLGSVRHRGTLEMELDSDLVSRLWWPEDPVPIDQPQAAYRIPTSRPTADLSGRSSA